VIAYLDGSWIDATRAAVPIHDRGFLYGDGVFETARLHAGGWFRLRAHLDRLAASAALLGIEIPPAEDLTAIAGEIVDRNDIDEGSLRITITRGGSGDAPGTILVTLYPIAGDWQRRADSGWRVATARTRRPSIDSVPAELKSLGRTWSILARREAAAAGVDDVLLLSAEGYVSEGPTWNVFWRRRDRLFTPSAAAGVLGGITRAAILEIASRAGLAVEEGVWMREALDDADEIFATMSSVGVVSIVALDGVPVPAGRAARLRAMYWELVQSETSLRE
jgi:branched-chain amino acid aminotransferase